jgi:DNA-binding transcriptional regulator LsrR (DeoR family)
MMDLEQRKEGRKATTRAPKTRPMPRKAATSGGPSGPEEEEEEKETTFARRRRQRLQDLMKNFELVSLVGIMHVRGATLMEIFRAVRKKFPKVTLKRADPSSIIRLAAERKWFRFQPPRHDEYRQEILDLHALEGIEVISSSEVDVIALAGARMLLRMLRSFGESKEVVHVGVAGGHTIRALMKALANEIGDPFKDMPKVVHFHALAAGFNPDEPSTNPNAFVTFFDDKFIATKIRFTGLSAPAIVENDTFEKLKKNFADIREAFEAMKLLDIVVTSGSTWHEDGVLYQQMKPSDQEILEAEGIVGDLLWRPISSRGPIEAETDRAFTLIELDQLQHLVRKRKKVLVALAPCGLCGQLKGNLLEAILENKLANHVVVDARSAGQMLAPVSGDDRQR